VKALVARGMPFNEAVVKARNFHADYNLLKTDAAKWASRVLLTPRYQYAMWANLFPQIAKGAILGKRASGAGMSRAEGVKSLARIGGMLGLSMAQAAMMGYALIEGYRFVKETGDDDEPEEDVALMVGPFAEPFKVVGRARQGYASGGIPKALLRVAFNKLAVFPHVAVSLVQGRNWRGEEIFTRGATAGEKVAQLGKFLLHELYPIFQEADDWTNDKQEAVNKLLQLVAVTRYRRGPMRNYYMRRLKRDFADMKFNARKKMQDDPTNADRYAREASARMEKHSNQVQAYINANYDKLEKMKSPSAIDRIIAQFVPSLIDKPTKEPKH